MQIPRISFHRSTPPRALLVRVASEAPARPFPSAGFDSDEHRPEGAHTRGSSSFLVFDSIADRGHNGGDNDVYSWRTIMNEQYDRRGFLKVGAAATTAWA